MTDEELLNVIAAVCDFDRAGVEKWRAEALIIGRAVEQAARASVIEECAKECDQVANQAAKFSLGPQQDCASSLASNIRCLKLQPYAADCINKAMTR